MRLFAKKPRPVPPFNTYYPAIEGAGSEQQAYYRWLVGEFQKGNAPDVQGNLSYLFVRMYEVIGELMRTTNYDVLAQWFEFLRAGYAATTKVGSYLDTCRETPPCFPITGLLRGSVNAVSASIWTFS